MRQDHLASQILCLNSPTLVIVRIHGHNMRNQFRQWSTIQASQGQSSSNDSILVSLWQVSTRHYDFPKEHRRVWTMLARLCLSSLLVTCFYPGWSHDVDIVFKGSRVFRKLDVASDNVGVADELID